ncbi:hypothetical protein PR048_032938 [Dryococelus australis]|uniref:Uncharacterized protein n=1 Tax=Dryococelus australis TaxID=614101 RepID=A0ABQ9G7S8_9NEOP|nr:hypothetical protein PR048_032938 [Dryococelus australis]
MDYGARFACWHVWSHKLVAALIGEGRFSLGRASPWPETMLYRRKIGKEADVTRLLGNRPHPPPPLLERGNKHMQRELHVTRVTHTHLPHCPVHAAYSRLFQRVENNKIDTDRGNAIRWRNVVVVLDSGYTWQAAARLASYAGNTSVYLGSRCRSEISRALAKNDRLGEVSGTTIPYHHSNILEDEIPHLVQLHPCCPVDENDEEAPLAMDSTNVEDVQQESRVVSGPYCDHTAKYKCPLMGKTSVDADDQTNYNTHAILTNCIMGTTKPNHKTEGTRLFVPVSSLVVPLHSTTLAPQTAPHPETEPQSAAQVAPHLSPQVAPQSASPTYTLNASPTRDEDCLHLQNDIIAIEKWCKDNAMSLNLEKNCMKTNPFVFKYNIKHMIVNRVEFIHDLGVILDSKLYLHHHVDKRSRLDYCSVIWNFITNIYSIRIENLQKYIFKLIHTRFPVSSKLDYANNIGLSTENVTPIQVTGAPHRRRASAMSCRPHPGADPRRYTASLQKTPTNVLPPSVLDTRLPEGSLLLRKKCSATDIFHLLYGTINLCTWRKICEPEVAAVQEKPTGTAKRPPSCARIDPPPPFLAEGLEIPMTGVTHDVTVCLLPGVRAWSGSGALADHHTLTGHVGALLCVGPRSTIWDATMMCRRNVTLDPTQRPTCKHLSASTYNERKVCCPPADYIHQGNTCPHRSYNTEARTDINSSKLAPARLPRTVVGDLPCPSLFLKRYARGLLLTFWESHEYGQQRDLLASQTSSRLLEIPIRLATMKECSGETDWRPSPSLHNSRVGADCGNECNKTSTSSLVEFLESKVYIALTTYIHSQLGYRLVVSSLTYPSPNQILFHSFPEHANLSHRYQFLPQHIPLPRRAHKHGMPNSLRSPPHPLKLLTNDCETDHGFSLDHLPAAARDLRRQGACSTQGTAARSVLRLFRFSARECKYRVGQARCQVPSGDVIVDTAPFNLGVVGRSPRTNLLAVEVAMLTTAPDDCSLSNDSPYVGYAPLLI